MKLFEKGKETVIKGKNYVTYIAAIIYSDNLEAAIGKEELARPVKSLKTTSRLPLITNPQVIYKQTKHWNNKPRPRCPYCTYIDSGNNVVTLAARINRGSDNHPRRVETSRYCVYCERTFVKKKVVQSSY